MQSLHVESCDMCPGSTLLALQECMPSMHSHIRHCNYVLTAVTDDRVKHGMYKQARACKQLLQHTEA